jgi:hypothetical protein
MGRGVGYQHQLTVTVSEGTVCGIWVGLYQGEWSPDGEHVSAFNNDLVRSNIQCCRHMTA